MMSAELGETGTLIEDARCFADEVLRPFATEADRLAPAMIETSSLVKEASRRGLRNITLSPEQGGRNAKIYAEVRALEEIARGDAGFAMTLAHCWREAATVAKFGSAEARERILKAYLDDDAAVTSWAITEPHAGSDHTSKFEETLEAGPATMAVRDGDDWIINGEKCFITNASWSKLIIVFARTDASVPWTHGISAFIVERDTPGVTWSDLEDKLGLRTNHNARLHFDGVRVPGSQLLGEVNGGIDILHVAGAGSKAREAARSVGVAQAALDAANEFIGQRIQGGRVLTEHAVIQAEVAEMTAELEAARSLTWRAAQAVDDHRDEASRLESMAKLVASETGARVATKALQLFGHRGLLRDNPIEKLVRDAISLLPPPVGNIALRVRVGADLIGGLE